MPIVDNILLQLKVKKTCEDNCSGTNSVQFLLIICFYAEQLCA